MSLVVVVDYGMGNLRSVSKALEHVARPGQQVEITSDPQRVMEADQVVFPGQGAARGCMLALAGSGLQTAMVTAAAEKPFLGICMGMQVLLDHSEENEGTDCLGLFKGQVRYFGDDLKDEHGHALKIPHMGWNQVLQSHDHPVWHGIEKDARFYFVHSYYAAPEDASVIAATTRYGREFVSAIARDNVFAIQAHPEKSAASGLQLLKNFMAWNGQ